VCEKIKLVNAQAVFPLLDPMVGGNQKIITRYHQGHQTRQGLTLFAPLGLPGLKDVDIHTRNPAPGIDRHHIGEDGDSQPEGNHETGPGVVGPDGNKQEEDQHEAAEGACNHHG